MPSRMRTVVTLGVPVALFLASWSFVAAQQRVADSQSTQFNIELLRPAGGPVVPLFEGWYPNPDGTYELSFGYFNVNTEEVIEIPLGPDNFIEPGEFDGRQPTRFLPVPDGERRHYGVFTVTVPADFGDRDVVWTLRIAGQAFSVPGRLTSINYRVNGSVFPERRSASPLLQLEPTGPQAAGTAGITIGGLEASAGSPLPLTVWTTRSDIIAEDMRPINLRWFKHQGPGEVSFSPPELEVPTEVWRRADGGVPTTTEATFNEPGEYVLRVLAFNTAGEFEFHCCWTNGYVNVRVSQQ